MPHRDLPGRRRAAGQAAAVPHRARPVQARSRGTAWARRYATWNHEMDTLVGLAELNEADSVQTPAAR